MTATKPVIGFAGMTHLGLVTATGAAETGFRVVGFDADPDRVADLRAGRLPVVEPGLDDLLAANAGRLTFTDRVADLGACDLVFIAYDVPTNDRGESDLGPVRALLDEVAPCLKADGLLVVMCQVPPGFTRALPLPPGRAVYLVETLIFGQAVQRTLHPERFIVGLADPAAGLPGPLAAYLGAYGCPILPMRYESAELAKISINMFLVASVTTTNTLAEVCEAVGADWSEIAPSLRLDRRIGPHAYLAPGLGIAGGNLERDLATVARLGDAAGTDVGTVRAWQRNSLYRKNWALRTLAREVLPACPNPRLGMLGLAYKKDTDSVKNSPALETLGGLARFPVAAFDPVVAASPAWHPHLTQAPDALAVCRGADALLVMTPWDAFWTLDPDAIAAAMAGRVVVDPYRVLDAAAAARAGLRHLCLGLGPLKGTAP